MIKANELRIGNWVSNGEKTFTVDSNVIYDIANFEYYHLIGIPITKEILDKAGFTAHAVYYHLKDFYIHFDNSSHYVYAFIDYATAVNYLHQLQNLYFALTGEELQINL